MWRWQLVARSGRRIQPLPTRLLGRTHFKSFYPNAAKLSSMMVSLLNGILVNQPTCYNNKGEHLLDCNGIQEGPTSRILLHPRIMKRHLNNTRSRPKAPRVSITSFATVQSLDRQIARHPVHRNPNRLVLRAGPRRAEREAVDRARFQVLYVLRNRSLVPEPDRVDPTWDREVEPPWLGPAGDVLDYAGDFPFREGVLSDDHRFVQMDALMKEVYGPRNTSLLRLQGRHRSSDLGEANIDDVVRARRADHGVWTLFPAGVHLHPRVMQLIYTMGFYGVYRCRRMKVDFHLITALIERWREETHTFHFRVGEATITLQDIALLWGLPILQC